MKVSLIWLSLITIGIVLLLVSQKAYETFSDFAPVKEGFVSGTTSEIQITTCPANSKMYIDNNGRSVCCEGNVENGKCVGRPICTLSESGNDLPTCNTWYAALLDERGRDRCPSSMLNYFEGGKMGRGCTNGRRNKDGTAPDLASAKFCKLYTNEKDELLKEDSCTNQKMLEEAQCIVPNARKRLTRWHNNIPYQIQCDYQNPTTGLPSWCSEDISTYKQHQYAAKTGIISSNWEENYPSYHKINWCRPRKMVEIDKTISYDDLKQVSVNPESAAPTKSAEQKCTFRPGAYAELYPDLKAAFGYDEARLKKHYIDNGLREGRSPCGAIHPQCRFNSEEYYMLNPDVQRAGVDAAQHYKQYGINEGRQVCYPPGQKPPPPPRNKFNSNWKKVGGSLKQVEIDKNVVCGVNGNDDIYCADNDIFNNPNWTQVPGKLKHVAVSNGRLYGVNSNDDIYYKENIKNSPWKQIPGKLKQVDIDGNTVCGVNSIDDIWCKTDLESANWFKVPGKLKHVTISNNNMYGVNSNDDIYYKGDLRGGNWKQINGKLKQVSMEGNRVCGVNSNNDIYCKEEDLNGAGWEQINGKLKYISTSGGKQYGTSPSNEIFTA